MERWDADSPSRIVGESCREVGSLALDHTEGPSPNQSCAMDWWCWRYVGLQDATLAVRLPFPSSQRATSSPIAPRVDRLGHLGWDSIVLEERSSPRACHMGSSDRSEVLRTAIVRFANCAHSHLMLTSRKLSNARDAEILVEPLDARSRSGFRRPAQMVREVFWLWLPELDHVLHVEYTNTRKSRGEERREWSMSACICKGNCRRKLADKIV
jgi:hypothetical protein